MGKNLNNPHIKIRSFDDRQKRMKKKSIRVLCRDWCDNEEELSVLCNKAHQFLIDHSTNSELMKSVHIMLIVNELKKNGLDDSVDSITSMMKSGDLDLNLLAVTSVTGIRNERLKRNDGKTGV